jgi:hypothetical protein
VLPSHDGKTATHPKGRLTVRQPTNNTLNGGLEIVNQGGAESHKKEITVNSVDFTLSPQGGLPI